MFTGIVEGVGRVVGLRQEEAGARIRLTIDAGPIAEGVKAGESIAINGVCLTALDPRAEAEPSQLSFQAIDETMQRSNLGDLAIGSRVNLERALRADGRLDGHFVQGHVDGVGTVIASQAVDGEWRFTIEVPLAIAELCVPKGSICIDGVSLTIADWQPDTRRVTVALIPVTLERTILQDRAVGDRVNLEGDMIGKYIVAYLRQRGV